MPTVPKIREQLLAIPPEVWAAAHRVLDHAPSGTKLPWFVRTTEPICYTSCDPTNNHLVTLPSLTYDYFAHSNRPGIFFALLPNENGKRERVSIDDSKIIISNDEKYFVKKYLALNPKKSFLIKLPKHKKENNVVEGVVISVSFIKIADKIYAMGRNYFFGCYAKVIPIMDKEKKFFALRVPYKAFYFKENHASENTEIPSEIGFYLCYAEKRDGYASEVYMTILYDDNLFGFVNRIAFYWKRGDVSNDKKIRLFSELFLLLASVAQSLHDLNNKKCIIHGDIKPENILIKENGDGNKERGVALCDFGFAKKMDRMGKYCVPEEDGIFGTPGYCAPELMLAHRERIKRKKGGGITSDPAFIVAYSEKTEVYAFGIILFKIRGIFLENHVFRSSILKKFHCIDFFLCTVNYCVNSAMSRISEERITFNGLVLLLNIASQILDGMLNKTLHEGCETEENLTAFSQLLFTFAKLHQFTSFTSSLEKENAERSLNDFISITFFGSLDDSPQSPVAPRYRDPKSPAHTQ